MSMRHCQQADLRVGENALGDAGPHSVFDLVTFKNEHLNPYLGLLWVGKFVLGEFHGAKLDRRYLV